MKKHQVLIAVLAFFALMVVFNLIGRYIKKPQPTDVSNVQVLKEPQRPPVQVPEQKCIKELSKYQSACEK